MKSGVVHTRHTFLRTKTKTGEHTHTHAHTRAQVQAHTNTHTRRNLQFTFHNVQCAMYTHAALAQRTAQIVEQPEDKKPAEANSTPKKEKKKQEFCEQPMICTAQCNVPGQFETLRKL